MGESDDELFLQALADFEEGAMPLDCRAGSEHDGKGVYSEPLRSLNGRDSTGLPEGGMHVSSAAPKAATRHPPQPAHEPGSVRSLLTAVQQPPPQQRQPVAACSSQQQHQQPKAPQQQSQVHVGYLLPKACQQQHIAGQPTLTLQHSDHAQADEQQHQQQRPAGQELSGPAMASEAPFPPAALLSATAPAAAKRSRLRQLFDFLLVMDLEATCDKDKTLQPQPQEIIELSCVVVDTATQRLLPATFQRYVRPDQHPRLTTFCTALTGITQDMVDSGIPLRLALQQLDGWLREHSLLGHGRTFVPVTWRDWDLKVQMAMETKWRGILQPKWQKRWVDLSAVWVKHSNHKGNLRASVEAAGLQWDGRAHSAIDDARNTARLAIKLMQGGVILGVTGSFTGVDASGRFKQATLFASATSASRVRGSSVDGRASTSTGSGSAPKQQQQQQQRKRQVFDEAGAWNGCCFCGARAKKRQVKKPGPNNGREFWSCGKFSMTGGGAVCDFFKFCGEVNEPPPPTKQQKSGGRSWQR